MAKTGRPSKYSAELAREICTQIANGKSLRKICSSKVMPGNIPLNPVRIIRPADPDKLKALHSRRKAIEKQRAAVGLPKTLDRTFNAYR